MENFKSNLERDPSVEEIKKYTQEDVRRFESKRFDLQRQVAGDNLVSEVFEMGYDDIHGSSITLAQLCFALAMSENEIVDELAKRKREYTATERDINALIQAKVLKNMKILDLGAGSKLGFARWSRKFGANVWTADLCKVQGLESQMLTSEERQREIETHVSIDFNSSNAALEIKKKSGGNFILVTSANLRAGGFRGDEKSIAKPLMRTGAIHAQFKAFPSYGIKNQAGELESVSV